MIGNREFFLEASKNEKNNYEHEFRVENKRNGYFFQDFLSGDFTIKKFYENQRGLQNPDSMNFTLEFCRNEGKKTIVDYDVFENPFIEETIGDLLFVEKLLGEKAFTDRYMSKKETSVDDIVSIADKIVINDFLNDKEMVIFEGEVTKLDKKYRNNKIVFEIKVEDMTYKGFDMTFKKNTYHWSKKGEELYIYNSAKKQQSVLYLLCQELFKGEDIDELVEIDEIVYPYVDEKGLEVHRQLQYVSWKKDEKIYKEIANLVDSFGGKIYMANGRLTIKNPLGIDYSSSYEEFLPQDYSFGPSGCDVLTEISERKVEAQYNEVEIAYDKYYQDTNHKDQVEILNLKINNSEEAKLKVEANKTKETNNTWINFKFISDIVSEVNEIPVISAYKYVEENGETIQKAIEFKDHSFIPNNSDGAYYELEVNESGGKVRLFNYGDKEIFIEKFAMMGKPLMVMKNNTMNYTEVDLSKGNKKTFTLKGNQYIQNKYDAELLARYLYFKHCREKISYEFDANVATCLNPNTKISLNTIDIADSIMVTELNHNPNKTKVKAMRYKEFVIDNGISGVDNIENQVDYSLLEGVNKAQEAVTDTTIPPAPEGIEVRSEVMAISGKWNPISTRNDIKGYLVEVKEAPKEGEENNPNNFRKIKYTSSSEIWFPLDPKNISEEIEGKPVAKEYTMSVRGVTNAGKEGYSTRSGKIKPIIYSGQFDFSEDEQLKITAIDASLIRAGNLEVGNELKIKGEIDGAKISSSKTSENNAIESKTEIYGGKISVMDGETEEKSNRITTIEDGKIKFKIWNGSRFVPYRFPIIGGNVSHFTDGEWSPWIEISKECFDGLRVYNPRIQTNVRSIPTLPSGESRLDYTTNVEWNESQTQFRWQIISNGGSFEEVTAGFKDSYQHFDVASVGGELSKSPPYERPYYIEGFQNVFATSITLTSGTIQTWYRRDFNNWEDIFIAGDAFLQVSINDGPWNNLKRFASWEGPLANSSHRQLFKNLIGEYWRDRRGKPSPLWSVNGEYHISDRPQRVSLRILCKTAALEDDNSKVTYGNYKYDKGVRPHQTFDGNRPLLSEYEIKGVTGIITKETRTTTYGGRISYEITGYLEE